MTYLCASSLIYERLHGKEERQILETPNSSFPKIQNLLALLPPYLLRQQWRWPATCIQALSDLIVAALEHLEHIAADVAVQPLTIISPSSTMHGSSKHTTTILPFYKEHTINGCIVDMSMPLHSPLPPFSLTMEASSLSWPTRLTLLLLSTTSDSLRATSDPPVYHFFALN